MKYKVKFICYHYNTGNSDNHYYVNFRDFDSIIEATDFENRVKKQVLIYNDKSDGCDDRLADWENSDDYIEIENGFICDHPPKIVEFTPSSEKHLL